MRKWITTGLLVLSLLPSAAQTHGTASEYPRFIASWYGVKFIGKKTASGERYDPTKLTAANKTLPLGTRVRLTVAKTRKTVVVRINDRGPWIDHRDFDVSEAAAIALGIREKGIAEVLVEVVK